MKASLSVLSISLVVVYFFTFTLTHVDGMPIWGQGSANEDGDPNVPILYRRFIRRKPIQGRKQVEVYEIFETQRRPPATPYRMSDEELDRFIFCDFHRELEECVQYWEDRRANKVKTTTPRATSYTTTSTTPTTTPSTTPSTTTSTSTTPTTTSSTTPSSNNDLDDDFADVETDDDQNEDNGGNPDLNEIFDEANGDDSHQPQTEDDWGNNGFDNGTEDEENDDNGEDPHQPQTEDNWGNNGFDDGTDDEENGDNGEDPHQPQTEDNSGNNGFDNGPDDEENDEDEDYDKKDVETDFLPYSNEKDYNLEEETVKEETTTASVFNPFKLF